MAETTGSGIFFNFVFLVIAGIVAAVSIGSKKRREQAEAAERQAELLRVDAEIRAARMRAARGRPERAAYAMPAPVEEAIPFAVAAEEAPPPRDEARRSRKSSSRGLAAAEIGALSAEDVREAFVWREILAPCPGMRS